MLIETRGQIRISDFIAQPASLEYEPGNKVAIIAIYTAWPDPHIKWTREYVSAFNETKITQELAASDKKLSFLQAQLPSSKDLESRLIISDLSLLDSGIYSFEITADTEVQSRKLSLFVKSMLLNVYLTVCWMCFKFLMNFIS